MFPNLNIEKAIKLDNQDNYILPGGKTYKYDFEKGEFEIQDGRLVEIEGKEAIKIWIEKILRTEKFKFNIYKGNNKQASEYGVTIKNLIIGKKLPKFFLESEVKREIQEALKKHPEIEDIKDLEVEQSNANMTISFAVVLKNKDTLELGIKI